MINHVRTLLMQVSAEGNPGDRVFIDPDFRPLAKIPAAAAKFRRALFGEQPDWRMLEFRMFQLLSAVHATELDEHVRAFDPRITYLTVSRKPFFRNLWTPSISSPNADADGLKLSGAGIADEQLGLCNFNWKVVLNGVNATVTDLRTNSAATTRVTITQERTSKIPLQPKRLFCTLPNQNHGIWFVEAAFKPRRSFAEILSVLKKSISREDEEALFRGRYTEEPMKTWYACWKEHPTFVHRLGALALGAAKQLQSAYE